MKKFLLFLLSFLIAFSFFNDVDAYLYFSSWTVSPLYNRWTGATSARDMLLEYSWAVYRLEFVTWNYWSTWSNSNNNFSSANYWFWWSCVHTMLTAAWNTYSGTLNYASCAQAPSNFTWGIVWPMGATGATGPTGATGATWDMGVPWFSAYELAQSNWYTWSLIDWLWSLIWPMGATGATWSISLDLSQSWTISINNILSSNTNTWFSSSTWSYFVILEEKNWVYYIQSSTLYFLFLSLVIFSTVIYWLFKFYKIFLFWKWKN